MNQFEPRLETNPLLLALAHYSTQRDAIDSIAAGPKGSIRATIVSVDDPEERGRVKVVFDDMNPEKPQVEGSNAYGKREGVEQKSQWVDFSPAFKGRQPKRLVGKRVTLEATDGQYQYAVARDVIWDEGVLNKKTQQPDTGTMVRLPCYESGEFPAASAENVGLMVVELGGPMDSDWLCVCLKRAGEYIWVRHSDLAHGHSGQNDGKQPNDTRGDGEEPVNQQTVWDYVFPTSGGQMQKYSKYGTDPRANPYGGDSKWYEAPK
jgi:hypothetical protein